MPENDTWWELAKETDGFADLMAGVHPHVPGLTFEPWIGPRDEDPDVYAHRRLKELAPVIERMVAVARGPVPEFPPFPPEGVTARNGAACVWPRRCERVLRADAGRLYELRSFAECVTRVEAMVGLALHGVRQADSTWVIMCAGVSRSAFLAVRVFRDAVSQAQEARAALLARLAAFDDGVWEPLARQYEQTRINAGEVGASLPTVEFLMGMHRSDLALAVEACG